MGLVGGYISDWRKDNKRDEKNDGKGKWRENRGDGRYEIDSVEDLKKR